MIRVFSVPSGQKLFQFRRGTYPTRIFSISFDLSSSMLAVSSETDTIHIFKLGIPMEREGENSGNTTLQRGKSGMIESM